MTCGKWQVLNRSHTVDQGGESKQVLQSMSRREEDVLKESTEQGGERVR